jgi:hypothetical protein
MRDRRPGTMTVNAGTSCTASKERRMVLVPAGSSLTLRRSDGTAVTMVTMADVSAKLLGDLPAIPVMSLEDPAVRQAGVLELVSTSGVAWAEAELRDDMLRLLGDASDTLVQRRSSHRRPEQLPFVGTAELAREPGRLVGRRARFGGQVLNISASGVLLRAVPEDGAHCLPPGVTAVMIETEMPWGMFQAAVRVIDQRSEYLRGEFTWLPPSAPDRLSAYCSGR